MSAEERVLVFGDDASSGSDVAWDWISANRWPRWRVDVVTAVLPPVGPPVGPERARPRPWNPHAPRTAGPDSGFRAIEHLRAEADPRLVLGDQTEADLLVVGPRGQGELKALSIGSTADYVLHHPPAPLVIANAGRPVRRVLVCTDGSAAARRASTVLAGLPWAADAAVTVLSVADERHDHGVETETAGKECAHALDPVVRTVETRHVRGPLNKAILRELERTDADLLVLGATGHHGGVRRWLGSTARAMTHLSPVPVLVVPA